MAKKKQTERKVILIVNVIMSDQNIFTYSGSLDKGILITELFVKH